MRTDFYAHVPLSTNYIERIDLLANLRSELLSISGSIALVSGLKSTPTALHGMGGIGKSCLAIDAKYGTRAGVLSWLIAELDDSRMSRAVKIGISDELQTINEYGFNLSSASVLMTLSPWANNRLEIMRILRNSAAEYTIGMQNATREKALNFCAEFGKLESPIVSSQILGMIADAILEICENWRWL